MESQDCMCAKMMLPVKYFMASLKVSAWKFPSPEFYEGAPNFYGTIVHNQTLEKAICSMYSKIKVSVKLKAVQSINRDQAKGRTHV